MSSLNKNSQLSHKSQVLSVRSKFYLKIITLSIWAFSSADLGIIALIGKDTVFKLKFPERT